MVVECVNDSDEFQKQTAILARHVSTRPSFHLPATPPGRILSSPRERI